LPLFRWLLNMLRKSEKSQLRGSVVLTALELEFPPEDAQQQMDIMIGWGRYAEALVYEDNEDLLFLEPGGKA
jgi:NitT/TauT family transport system ATP-binding protein